jgi:hypothetical protein
MRIGGAGVAGALGAAAGGEASLLFRHPPVEASAVAATRAAVSRRDARTWARAVLEPFMTAQYVGVWPASREVLLTDPARRLPATVACGY